MSTEISQYIFYLNSVTVIIYCEGKRTDGEHIPDWYLQVAHAAADQDFYWYWGNHSKLQLCYLLTFGESFC